MPVFCQNLESGQSPTLHPEFQKSCGEGRLGICKLSFLCSFVARRPAFVAKATVTKHRTGRPADRNSFSQSRCQKSEIKVLAKLVPSDASVLGLWVAIFT